MKTKLMIGIASSLLFAGCASAVNSGMSVSADHTLKVETRTTNYLTDHDGMSLYIFDKDTINKSNCKGECLEKWPIFTSNLTNPDFAPLPDNIVHTAYRKHPLYYFIKDKQAGDTLGDNVKNIWHLVYPAKGFKPNNRVKLSSAAKVQKYLADNNDMTLYTFDKDTKNRSNCYNGCEAKWPVFYSDVNKLNLPVGIKKEDFGVIKRDDGKMQTTYKSKPLYYFFKDSKPKDTNGDWAKGVWHLVELK